MKVEDIHHIKKHGYVTVITVPQSTKLYIGDVLEQGNFTWKIISADKFHTACFTGIDSNRWGFILEPLGTAPPFPNKGEILVNNKNNI